MQISYLFVSKTFVTDLPQNVDILLQIECTAEIDMSLISPILEEYILLGEKIEWFIAHLDHIIMLNKRQAEIYFRCTQIPRNTQWQDMNIINIVDAMDKTREACEKISIKYEETLNFECKEILQKVKAQICYLHELETNVSDSLQKYLEDLAISRRNHVDAWKKKDADVWMTEQALKYSLKQYLNKNEQWNKDLKREIHMLEKTFYEISESFYDCINTSQILQKNQALLQANIHHLTIKDQQMFKRDLFFDFPENEIKQQENDDEIQKCKFDEEFDKLITDLRCDNENIKKDISVRSCGIYKVKKGYETKLALVVITETRFLHAFDVENMIDEKTITEAQRITFRKLNELKKGISFFSFKNEIIDKTEENSLLELKKYFLNHLNVTRHMLRGFPFNINSRFLRFDKKRKEITITDKKSPTLKRFFISNCIKIKPFMDKDIFELFCALCKKASDTKEETKLKEIHEEIEEEQSESVSQASDDDNPWIMNVE